MKFTREIISRVAKRIRPIVDQFSRQYDEAKYPAASLLRFRHAFSTKPMAVGAISQALEWKWGHAGKRNYPAHHKRLMAQAEGNRAGLSKTAFAMSDAQTFEFWTRVLGQERRFVTRAFLTHLSHFKTIAIVDQHNWRAMRCLLDACRSGIHLRKVPRDFSDLRAISAFELALSKSLTIPLDRVDRFLMMYGKSLK